MLLLGTQIQPLSRANCQSVPMYCLTWSSRPRPEPRGPTSLSFPRPWSGPGSWQAPICGCSRAIVPEGGWQGRWRLCRPCSPPGNGGQKPGTLHELSQGSQGKAREDIGNDLVSQWPIYSLGSPMRADQLLTGDDPFPLLLGCPTELGDHKGAAQFFTVYLGGGLAHKPVKARLGSKTELSIPREEG